MPSLIHHPLDPSSRLIRLMCAEYGVPLDMEEIKPWLRDAQLLEINPAATLPILIGDSDQPIVGVLATIHMVEDLYTPTVVEGADSRRSGRAGRDVADDRVGHRQAQ